MPEFEVLSRTQGIKVHHIRQRIVVDQNNVVRIVGGPSLVNIVNAGSVGPAGPLGPTGPTGPQGPVGGRRFYGSGPPGTIIGSQPNDEYVDVDTGDLYTLQ